ncbi:MAG: TetR family transcriptional regulator C-terminal domain-containing protein, partial [Oscillospiraceae bacterium]|nr:TetR family transcriptional regulator C-terminal domain-containing protein [Oscillospiraceae bacterium]
TITKIELGEYNIDENMFGDGMLEYHIEFFRSGFNAMVKKWLSGGCKESPEQLSLVLKNEYRGRR